MLRPLHRRLLHPPATPHSAPILQSAKFAQWMVVVKIIADGTIDLPCAQALSQNLMPHIYDKNLLGPWAGMHMLACK